MPMPRMLQRLTAWLISIAAVSAIVIFVGYQRRHPSTDDAYLQGYVISIAPQVSGPVLQVPVVDNQAVKKGELLFEIEPAPFQLALDDANARLAAARQQFEMATSEVKAAESLIENRKAAVANFQDQFDRLGALVKQGAETPIQFETVTSQLQAAQANLNAALDALQRAQIARGTEETNPQILSAKSAVAMAALNLSYCKVFAPCDGWVTNCVLAAGNYVTTGIPVFAMVQSGTFWLSANFRETEVSKIQPGMRARVTLRGYPGRAFEARVQGTAWAIYQQSLAKELVPVVNPTIDWVQLAQRFPVRIDLIDPPADLPLRVGASGSATILLEQ